jgi:hypothetical protein
VTVVENWMMLMWALLTAAPHMAATRKVDPRMQCELVRVEADWISVGVCERKLGHSTTRERTFSSAVRETYWSFSFDALSPFPHDPCALGGCLHINGSLQP